MLDVLFSAVKFWENIEVVIANKNKAIRKLMIYKPPLCERFYIKIDRTSLNDILPMKLKGQYSHVTFLNFKQNRPSYRSACSLLLVPLRALGPMTIKQGTVEVLLIHLSPRSYPELFSGLFSRENPA